MSILELQINRIIQYSCVSGFFPQYNVCEIYPHYYTSVVYNYLLLNNMPLFIHSPFWGQLDRLWQMYIRCNHHDKTEHFHYLRKLPCAPFTTKPFSHHDPRHYCSASCHYSCAFSRTSYNCTYTLCRLECLLLPRCFWIYPHCCMLSVVF